VARCGGWIRCVKLSPQRGHRALRWRREGRQKASDALTPIAESRLNQSGAITFRVIDVRRNLAPSSARAGTLKRDLPLAVVGECDIAATTHLTTAHLTHGARANRELSRKQREHRGRGSKTA
jgi:hypothetical protein